MNDPSISWKKVAVLATGGSIFSAVVILWIIISGFGPYMGEYPEFSFTLIDNGNNDYIDIKFISAGTGMFKLPVPLSLENFEIRIEQENFVFTLHQTSMFLGDDVKFFFNVDIVEKGKEYEVMLVDLSFYRAYKKTVICE